MPSGATETAIMQLIVSNTFTPEQISQVRHRCKTCHLMADLQLHCVRLILPCAGTARACNLDKNNEQSNCCDRTLLRYLQLHASHFGVKIQSKDEQQRLRAIIDLEVDALVGNDTAKNYLLDMKKR